MTNFLINEKKNTMEDEGNLKFLRELPKQSQDVELIHNSFKKHFFLRSIDKNAR